MIFTSACHFLIFNFDNEIESLNTCEKGDFWSREDFLKLFTLWKRRLLILWRFFKFFYLVKNLNIEVMKFDLVKFDLVTRSQKKKDPLMMLLMLLFLSFAFIIYKLVVPSVAWDFLFDKHINLTCLTYLTYLTIPNHT